MKKKKNEEESVIYYCMTICFDDGLNYAKQSASHHLLSTFTSVNVILVFFNILLLIILLVTLMALVDKLSLTAAAKTGQ